MLCSVYSVSIVPVSTLRLPWLRFFRVFPSVVRQMPGYNSQRRCTVRTLPNYFDHSGFESQKAFQPKLLIVFFHVLFVCKCVLYYCNRVSTKLELTNISYHNPLRTKLYLFNLETQSVPCSKHSLLRLQKTEKLMLYKEIIAVCSEIHTKHINTLRAEHRISEC